MFMVLILHILGRGGVLNNCVDYSLNYHVSWLMEIASYCAVNTFALTTGFLMINKKFKSSGIINLWVQVLFYGLIINALFAIFVPNSVGMRLWIKSLIPVTGNLWWYFTSYFCLFFFIPFINKMLVSLNKRQTSILIFLIFILFSIINLVQQMISNDAFSVASGYSPLWLAVLYILGAYIRRYNVLSSLKKRWCAVSYFVCILLTFVGMVGTKYFTKQIFGASKAYDIFINYNSLFIVLMAVSLLLLFSKLTFPRPICKALAFLSPLSFAVYIIHEHHVFKDYFITNRFSYLSNENAFVLIGSVLIAAIIIFAVCILIEALRVKLFKLTRITKLINKLGAYIDKKLKIEL